MDTPSTATSYRKVFAISLVVITWISVGLQLELMTGTVANFFSYFTVPCNQLIAISLICAALVPRSAPGKFLSQLSVQMAIVLGIKKSLRTWSSPTLKLPIWSFRDPI